jgi:radical SAM superfamily enzyme YgiQ (UPF0313 family)
MDVLFVNPGNASGIYQNLANSAAAIEPPTWALLLAESVRSRGFEVGILDVNAERLKVEDASRRVALANPRLICFVVYGQNVNAGTVSMSGAVLLSEELKRQNPKCKISFVGSYVQALPKKVLSEEKSIDFIFLNEGVYALWNILELQDFCETSLKQVNGIGFKSQNGNVVLTNPEMVVPNDKMDTHLPGYAWDLLPYLERPLDIYRSPLWHADYREENRSPYAAIQTSLGCNYGCSFCMINIVNRNDNEEIGVASNYKGMRFWSTEHNLRQFDILNSMKVQTIRIVDEMFLLYKKHYVPLCEELAKRSYAENLRMWSYSRIDTVTNEEFLRTVRAAGIRWLCLGIESATKAVRLEVSKGRFEDVDIKRVIEHIHNSGIEVMANYIVGLPGEDRESMQRTLDLSLELCTSGWNMYAAMALPGSELYKNALERGDQLPSTYTGYSFHSEDTLPLSTGALSAREILEFRDRAFKTYHDNADFLSRINRLYGPKAVANIKEISKIDLKRNLLKQL